METSHSCYCCTRALPSPMDIDSALNELGMLSSVTNSRKQYLRERIHRSRNLSESTAAVTPCTSPVKPTYQVVHLNPKFVTGLSTTSPSKAQEASESSHALHDTKRDSFKENQISQTFSTLSLGQKYSPEGLESEAKLTRLSVSRAKASRNRRFKKPYEVPWRISMETEYKNVEHHKPNCLKTLYTPNKLCADDKDSSSNVSTPDKLSELAKRGSVTVQRSRSLDDLEFAKLRLAEDGDGHQQNFVSEKQDIETVSQHLKDLHMFE